MHHTGSYSPSQLTTVQMGKLRPRGSWAHAGHPWQKQDPHHSLGLQNVAAKGAAYWGKGKGVAWGPWAKARL